MGALRHPGRVQPAQRRGRASNSPSASAETAPASDFRGRSAGKIRGRDESVYVPHRHTQEMDARSNAVDPQILPSNMLVSSNAPGVCSFVRIGYKIFRNWSPRLAACLCRADGPWAAGPSRFRGTAVPCSRLKSCWGRGRRLTECHMGPGGTAGWRASWGVGIRLCLAGKRLHGEEIRSSAASFRIPKWKTASVCAGASHLLYSNGVPKKRGSSPWQ